MNLFILSKAWGAIRRQFHWPTKKICVEPDEFISSLRTWRPKMMSIYAVNDGKYEDSRLVAYQMSFDIMLGRMPIRFMTAFDAALVPNQGARIVMLQVLAAGKTCSAWETLPDTVKAFVRLLDNKSGSIVNDPAAMIASGPTDPAPQTSPLTMQTIAQRLYGTRRPDKPTV